MANYIYPAPGVTSSEATLAIEINADSSNDSLAVPSLQDITVNNSNDVFTWTQLDETAKKQVATTSTNSIAMNLVVEQESFFGDGTSSAGTASLKGIFGMSKDKDLVDFTLFLGKESDGTAGKTITGSGYITGLAPTTSADAPVWVTPITITVTGEYTVS